MIYREMTEEQRLAWGAAEDQARAADIAEVRSAESLKAAQAAAARRRNEIGATAWQATEMVLQAQRRTAS